MGTVEKISVFLVLWVCFEGYAQEYETILWTPEKRLSWNDFKAVPPESDRVAATTASGITYQFSSILKGNEVNIDFTVSTYFYPNKSWYHPNLSDELVLSHEQLHFDISELFARKMREKLSKTIFTKNVKSEVRTIYKRILQELEEYQNLYDEETNFSRNREKQLEWNAKIKEDLKS